MHGHGEGPAAALPEACRAGALPAIPMEDMQHSMPDLTEFQRRMMAGMAAADPLMMQGMMADDPDIAFACAMIPHHQSAIAMAEVELEFGDAGPMRDLAARIIDAQRQEIAELVQWIEQQSP